MKKIVKKLVKILILLFTFLSGLIFVTEVWLFRTWSDLNANEVIFHLTQPLDGSNPEMVVNYLVKYALSAVLIMAVAIAVAIYAHKKAKALQVYIIYFVGSLFIIGASVFLLEKKLGMVTYVRSYLSATYGSGEDFIGDNYADPEKVSITFPEKKRNLIFIYLESVEMSFADPKNGGIFDENLIPELTELGKEGEDFSGGDTTLEGGVSLSGTNWTMGAMFGQTSGIPLQVSIGGNGMSNQDEFFPDLVTLGDILEDQGYTQKLLIGSAAKFGGRDTYFAQHGEYEMLDYNWAKDTGKIPEDYKVWWGYEDRKLYDFAKEELETLASKDEPFNLSILTVDTHFENGYVCPLCKKEHGDNQYANVFSCASRQACEFVEWLKQQPFYENTTVILSGDHPTMDKDFCNDVPKEYQRRTFFTVLNGVGEPKITEDRKYTTLDIFPTTLSSMGVDIEGGRLGLGTDLYSDQKTLLEEYGFDELEAKVSTPSRFMTKKSHIVVTTQTLDKINNSEIKFKDGEDGNLVISIPKIKAINVTSLEKAEMEVESKSTGEIKKYDMEIKPKKNDPNKFSVKAKTDIPKAKKSDIIVRIYFTVQGINHYKVYEWSGDSEE